MKTILVDLNVILDYLQERSGCEKAGEILALCFQKKIMGYVCAHEITTLAYFLGKISKNRKENIKVISRIFSIFDVIAIDRTILGNALQSNIADFEDAVVVESAKMLKVDCIVTGNIRDFKNSPVPAMLPEEFILQVGDELS
ncbi:MAG: PIN domain-containing protein [Treponema sp.]|nr:PIN domain-containing protein [Treponema sp.]